MTDITSLDSGFDAPDGMTGVNHSAEAGVHIRVTMPEDPSYQMIIIARPVDLVWTLKRKVLDSITQHLKDSLNYGLYCPPSNMRVGKYLDEERPIKEYPLSVPIGLLEFKYKKRIYKMDINPLKLKKMHTPTELKTFLDLVSQGKVEEINAKMNRGFDPNFNSVSKGETPLTLAATLTRPGAVILALVGGGAFIDFRNKKGLTPLHVATEVGNKDAVRILLDLGSSPNYKDADGLTPLCYATRKDTPAVCIQWLLQERADIGRRDKKGWMEIHYACEQGLIQHLEQLLYYGADRNALTSDSNETPLHICARSNQGECARLLLIRGADKSLENKSKQDPAQVARASGNENVANIISNFSPEQVELFSDIPKYNEKRRGTISVATLRNLQRSRSNPNLLQQLFQQDSVLSATVSQAAGVQYLSNGLIPNGVRSPGSHGRPPASDLFGIANGNAKTESSTQNHVERIIELHRGSAGFGFVLRGPLDPPGSTLNFLPTSDIPARQYIESVDPDSTAEKAGLVAGDFILEINDQNVVISSHKECVKLMRNGGDALRLKVIRVQKPGTLRNQQTKQTHNGGGGGIVEIHSRDSMETNSQTSSETAQAQSALNGLEALENLDAALDNFDLTTNSSEEQTDIPETPPAPMEFSSDAASVNDVVLFTPPPPPPQAYDDEVEMPERDFPVPPPVLNEEVIAVLHGRDSVPDIHASVLSEPEPHASVVKERERGYREPANEVEEPKKANGAAAVVAVGGIVSVESKEKVKVDSADKKGARESPSKHVKVESPKEKTPVEQMKIGSDEKLDKSTSGKRAVSLAYAVANDENKKSVNVQPKKTTEVTSNRKSYAAPAAPPQPSKSTSSPTIAASKVAVASVTVSASQDNDDHPKETSNENHSDDIPADSAPSSKVAAPPPPPPLPPPSFGTISRSTAPVVTDDNNRSPPSGPSGGGRKILDESRKRDESHAVLMAAILKRKNVVDSTDGDQLADNIDARVNRTRKQQKIVYRADNTKEVKLPPAAAVGLLTPAEGAVPISKDDDSPGFRAEAEKMRQAFLLKKSVSSNKPETTQAQLEENGKAEERKPVAPSTNGGLPREDAKTFSTINRPKSTAANAPQPPVLADVAAIIAQKALARQKREEAEPKVDEAKLKIADAEPKVAGLESKATEASPKMSNLSVEEQVKASIANRRSAFESGTLKPAVLATLPKNSNAKVVSSSSANANNTNGQISPATTKSTPQPTVVTNQQSKIYGGGSITVQTNNNNNQDSTLTLPNTKLGNVNNTSNRNTYIHASSTIATSSSNVPRNRNSSVYPSSPPHQMTTLPAVAKPNSVKPSVVEAAPLVIPPPVEFATPTESGFVAEIHTTATLRSKTSQSNSMVFRAKSSVGSDPKTAFRSRSIATWNEDDVAEWLKSFDYSDYLPLFAEKKINGQVLAQMKANELEAMGISNMLHRNRIEREIRSAVARK